MKLLKSGVKIKVLLLLAVTLSCLSVFRFLPAQAEDFFLIELIPAIRQKTLIFETEDKNVSLSIKAGTSTADVSFKFFKLLPLADVASVFETELGDLVPAGDIFSLSLVPYAGVDFSGRPKISVKFGQENKLKSLYYLDRSTNQFVKLAAQRDTKKNILSFEIPEVEELVFGLFEEPVQQGTASWYVHPRYPKELMAASTDFSFGAKVKVTNLANGKEVIVTIKDYGPDKSVHPDRVIDLGKEAFKKIASTRAGIIDVKVEPFIVVTSTAGFVAQNK